MENKTAVISQIPGETTLWWKRSLRTIIITLLVVGLLRALVIDSYVISSESMEGELMVGEKVFVNKLHYGARMPSVLKVPFINEDWTLLRFFNIRLHSAKILPYLRMPGFTRIQRNDILAFNLPTEEKTSYELKTNYTKRCVALPGDELKIVGGELYVNQKLEPELASVQHGYKVVSKEAITRQKAASLGISDYLNQVRMTDQMKLNGEAGYFVNMPSSAYAKVASDWTIKSVTPVTAAQQFNDLDVYPHSIEKVWNEDFFGPVIIPGKGITLKLNADNSILYYAVIRDYELPGKTVSYHNKTVFIDQNPVTEFTFTKDYYFLLGDNRNVSFDSRFWGFLPDDHIIGKVTMVWMSRNSDGIQWKRILRSVH
jgi:signal peptidase I